MASVPIPDAAHLKLVAEALLENDVVPFLGAGANLRPKGAVWAESEQEYPPLGGELALHLAAQYKYEFRKNEQPDLLRISQYGELSKTTRDLYRRLSKVFNRDYPFNALHQLLAEMPARLRKKGAEEPNIIVVTTNYDDMLERAFRDRNEPIDVVYYVANGPNRGKFVHESRPGVSQIINSPQTYTDLSLKKSSILFKIHGAVDRSDLGQDEREDSFVITEDHYIDYLTRTDLSNVPKSILAKLKLRSFLFLGYSLRDWNLRAFLHRIWEQRVGQTVSSWAIQKEPDDLEAKFWGARLVTVYNSDLTEYTKNLRVRLKVPDARRRPEPARSR